MDAPFDGPALAVDQFELCKPEKEGGVVCPLCCALPCDPAMLPQEGRQLQRLEVVLKEHLRDAAHLEAPVSSPMYASGDVFSTRALGR